MEVDVLVDSLTDCLIKKSTGEQVETEYRLRTSPIEPVDYQGWKFNWK